MNCIYFTGVRHVLPIFDRHFRLCEPTRAALVECRLYGCRVDRSHGALCAACAQVLEVVVANAGEFKYVADFSPSEILLLDGATAKHFASKVEDALWLLKAWG